MASGTVAAIGGREVLHDAALLQRARLRPPAVVTIWRALPAALRPSRCPATIDELAAALAGQDTPETTC